MIEIQYVFDCGTHHECFKTCRIFKQTVRSAGANLTVKHIREVSLSVLFLMEAASKADQTFLVPPRSSAHTVSDVAADVTKMVAHLVERKVCIEDGERTTPTFKDPTENGIFQQMDKRDSRPNHCSRS